jgi:long-chain acyl-CoA synthetase
MAKTTDAEMTSPAHWPVVSMRETLRRLTAPGAPFEMTEAEIRGRRMRVYVAAVENMALLFNASRRFGARDLMVYEGERLSFDHHWRAATTLGHALGERFGIGKGARVAVAMRNFPEWSICAWAVLAAGAVLVPLNAWESGVTLARMITDSGAKLVIADGERAERLGPYATGLPPLITTRQDGGAQSLEAVIGRPGAYGALNPAPLADKDLAPDDDATIFYTSGTTGAAKGAVGTHRNIATNLVNTGFRNARAAVRRGMEPPQVASAERRQLLPLPFFHVTGFQSTLVPALANGTTLVLMHKWDQVRALELIENDRVNGLTLVPSQAIQLTDIAAESGRDLSSVDAVGYGGAAAPDWLAEKVRAVFPAAWPGQGYGATETSSLTSANSAEDMLARPDSVGVSCPACDVKAIRDDGSEAAPGEPGELWVNGPNVVRGYWNQPEASAEAFVDGWYRTGDIGSIDTDGFITLLDRAKDMLIRGGENIYCAEIEGALGSHPAVAEAAVIGLPDALLGEVVGAVIHLKPGQQATGSDIVAHVSAILAAHKRPVAIQFRDQPLPRNAAGKILKRDLKPELLAKAKPVQST